MSKWPKRDRPRERLRELGPSSLSDSEVLALLLSTGSGKENAVEVARRILVQGGGVEAIARQGMGELGRIAGVGEVKASRIVAAVEFGFRIVEQTEQRKASSRFESSADIFESYKTRLAVLREEVFVVVGLNSRNEPIHELAVAQGSVNECRVAPATVFRPMIVEAAARAVLLHNHPSGDPTPSPHDVALTKRLVSVGEMVGIPILDHVIIGRNSYSSLRDLGLLL
ncbi:MAG: DNA repair protein RadC [Proteobacteria bacterium]|nr:DNA repair protein RadC [Pseudomonadota bacterium]